MIYRVGFAFGWLVRWLDRVLERFQDGIDGALGNLQDGFTAGRFYGEPESPGTKIHEFAKMFASIAPKGPAPATDPRSLLVTPEDKNRGV